MAQGVQIGKVARKTGLSIDTIRFYEKKHLLREPPRSEGGYRLYSERDIEHLLFIRKAQELGFSLAEIRELLVIQDERTEACTHVHGLIQHRLQAVQQKIADLKRLQGHLEAAEAKCAEALGHHECCPVLREIQETAPYDEEKAKMKVEILYFEGCPNHPPAVERVRSVLREQGLPEHVTEIQVSAAEAAKTAGFLGSPTILINGQDIDPAVRTLKPSGFSCRTYVGGVPSAEMIRAALTEAHGGNRSRG